MKNSSYCLRASKNNWPIALIVFLAPSMIFAAEFQGADSVLKKVEEQSASTNATTNSSDEAVL
ncbi:MAG: hypothetical protein ABIR24_06270, partial [Verrucomicrobiota bacterium]